uniref:Uncharacterized protein n=1 Tax=Onchocerca volvulus TaxID=6282 RepID=A0A8R1U177_ONCVO
MDRKEREDEIGVMEFEEIQDLKKETYALRKYADYVKNMIIGAAAQIDATILVVVVFGIDGKTRKSYTKHQKGNKNFYMIFGDLQENVVRAD